MKKWALTGAESESSDFIEGKGSESSEKADVFGFTAKTFDVFGGLHGVLVVSVE